MKIISSSSVHYLIVESPITCVLYFNCIEVNNTYIKFLKNHVIFMYFCFSKEKKANYIKIYLNKINFEKKQACVPKNLSENGLNEMN